MKKMSRHGWRGVSILLVAFFFFSVVYGQYINYSPVPIVDYWNGVLNFYVESMRSSEAWWVQHNEHRILLSKLLFWLDMRYLGGRSLLLIPVNTVLLLAVFLVLMLYAERLIPWREDGARAMMAALVFMLCFSWMQNQNIIWGFQSQFILVYLLPLGSFYAMARAQYAPAGAWWWRLLAISLGMASAYSMANGLLALPVLVGLCWLVERSCRNALVVAVVTVAATLVFFIGYQPTVGGSIGLRLILDDPLRLLMFSLAYLGNPLYWISGSTGAAVCAGAFAVSVTIFLFWRRKSFVAEPYASALIAFILYVFGAAAITALGRAFFDISLAASSRYTTPALLMWASLAILLVAQYGAGVRWVVLSVAALLIPSQMKAFSLDTGMFTPHQKAVAALSLRMHIDEERAKRQLHPFYTAEEETYLLKAREAGVSIFSLDQAYPVDQLGKPLSLAGGEPCAGEINKSRPVEAQRPATAIYGALRSNEPDGISYILFGDSHGLVKGIAMAGRDQPGEGGEAGPHNFDGFLLGNGDFHGMRCIYK